MAWLEKRGRKYRLSYRYDGQEYHHSLGTSDPQEADACRARLEDTVNRLERGWLKLPPGADLSLFLLSGGEVAAKPVAPSRAPIPVTLKALSDAYLAAQAASVEASSLGTIGIHLRHLVRTLGEAYPVASLTLADLQSHVDRRRKQRGRRGKPISSYTIRKELSTFGAAWKWAALSGLVTRAFPNAGLKYPKADEKPPFQTRAEIERQIARGGLTDREQQELWDGLFLTLPEIAELLGEIQGNASQAWTYPMACAAAHTGARRSELLRARLADLDLEAGTLVIREKKRVKGRNTTRTIPLSPFLAEVLRAWLTIHPGGRICSARTGGCSGARRSGTAPPR